MQKGPSQRYCRGWGYRRVHHKGIAGGGDTEGSITKVLLGVGMQNGPSQRYCRGWGYRRVHHKGIAGGGNAEGYVYSVNGRT